MEIEPKGLGTDEGPELKLAHASFKIVKSTVRWAFYLNLSVNQTPELHAAAIQLIFTFLIQSFI